MATGAYSAQARDAINSGRLPIGQSDAATILAALAYHIDTPAGWTYRQKKLERLDGIDLMCVGLCLEYGATWDLGGREEQLGGPTGRP